MLQTLPMNLSLNFGLRLIQKNQVKQIVQKQKLSNKCQNQSTTVRNTTTKMRSKIKFEILFETFDLFLSINQNLMKLIEIRKFLIGMLQQEKLQIQDIMITMITLNGFQWSGEKWTEFCSSYFCIILRFIFLNHKYTIFNKCYIWNYDFSWF